MTRPGRLRHRITIQQVVSSPARDEMGVVDPTDSGNWETYFQCDAEIITRGAKQFRSSKAVTTEVTHFFTVRHSSETAAITDSMRIQTSDGRLMSVVAVYEADQTNHWIEIHAREQA